MASLFGPEQIGRDGLPALIQGQSDLALIATPAGMRLASVTGVQGGVVLRDPASLAEMGSRQFTSLSGRFSEGQVEAITLGGRPALAVFGLDAGLRLYWADQAEPLSHEIRLPFGGATLASLATAPLSGGRDLIFTTSLQASGISIWLRGADGALSALGKAPFPEVSPAPKGSLIADLMVIKQGAAQFLIAPSAADHSLTVWQIAESGALKQTQHLGFDEGLSTVFPHQLTSVSLGGRSYVLLAGAGNSSISVLELNSSGRLIPRDQVNDDLRTRFEGVTALTSVVAEGRAFIAASGRDGGVSLLELLPGGRLVHLGSQAETGSGLLAAPTGLVLAHEGEGLQLYLTSAGSSGVARLDLDLAALTLHRDSAAPSVLKGTPGADLFILTPGGGEDRIEGFQLGLDRLDLSALGRIYSVAAFDLKPLSNGIELKFGAEKIRILSADGQSISPADLAHQDLMGLWHVPLNIPEDYIPPPPKPVLPEARNLLHGSAQNDQLLGAEADPAFDAATASVYRLYRAVLDRVPDRGGLENWTDHLLSGRRDLLDLADGFIDSPEFLRRFGQTGDVDFVTLLYNNVLGRAPDERGLANWTGHLASGMSRAEVVMHFSESREFTQQMLVETLTVSRAAEIAAAVPTVYRLYQATLNRAPDAGGLLNWTTHLAKDKPLLSVIEGFIYSQEFQRRYGETDNLEFVTLLYKNVLGRAPDERGLASWTGNLAAGMSRAEVVMHFSESREFIRLTRQDTIDYMRKLGPDDELKGFGGSDLLAGFYGADRYHLDAAWGKQKVQISGFEPWDWLVLEGFGYATAAEAMGHVRSVERGLMFQDRGVELYLPGVTTADLQAALILL